MTDLSSDRRIDLTIGSNSTALSADTVTPDRTLVGWGGSVDSDARCDTTHPIRDPSWPLGATVLIIDDDIDVRLLMRLVLVGAGLTVVGDADNGIDGLRVWRELGTAPGPDVVIVDNQMPGMNGLDVSAVMLAERPAQRIVLCTSFLHPAIETRAEQIGIRRCVAKGDLLLLPQVLEHLRRPVA